MSINISNPSDNSTGREAINRTPVNNSSVNYNSNSVISNSNTISNNNLQAQIIEQNNGSKLLQNMLAGDTFTGNIIEIKDDSVIIQLNNGASLSARLMNGINLNIGQNITFMVEENNHNIITLKPLIADEQEAFIINKALDAANIPVTEQNIKIVKELLTLNMPVGSDMLTEVFKNVHRFPDTSANTIANLIKLDVPVTQENIAQFEAYKNYEHSISKELNQLSNSISSVITDVISHQGTDKGVTLLNSIFTNLYKKEYPTENVDNKSAENTDVLRNIKSYIDGDLRNELSVKITRLFGEESNSLVQTIKDGNISNKELVSDLLKLINNYSNNSTEWKNNSFMLKDLLNSNAFKTIISQTVGETMKIVPKDVSKDKSISSFYQKVLSKIQNIGQETNKAAPESDFAKNLQNIKNNIDFMNDLNKNMTYFQIPIKFSQSEGNGELYVFTNKKALKHNSDNVSALLHLDMEHLGAMDIFVKLSGKTVSTNFCLESEDLLDFVYSHIDELDKRLEDLGYTTKFEMKVADSKTNHLDFVNDFVEKSSVSSVHAPTSSYVFDIKA